VPGQVHVTDERHRVDERVRDNERADATRSLEEPAEDDTEHCVPEESPEALVEVVRAAKERGRAEGAVV
jgi:hypothetical protein